MPTYTYACKKCEHAWDVFHAMSATPKLACPECDSKRVEKQIGTGAGIIFKGSGFYETDFKEKKGTRPVEGGAKTEAKAETKSEGKAESKTESKSESKPAAAPKVETAKKSSAKAAAKGK
jgi:putative FmdB family regulatory protein